MASEEGSPSSNDNQLTFAIAGWSQNPPPRPEPPPAAEDLIEGIPTDKPKDARAYPTAANLITMFEKMVTTVAGYNCALDDCIIIPATEWQRSQNYWSQRLNDTYKDQVKKNAEFEKLLNAHYQEEFSESMIARFAAQKRLKEVSFERETGEPAQVLYDLKDENAELKRQETVVRVDILNLKARIAQLDGVVGHKDSQISELNQKIRTLEEKLKEAVDRYEKAQAFAPEVLKSVITALNPQGQMPVSEYESRMGPSPRQLAGTPSIFSAPSPVLLGPRSLYGSSQPETIPDSNRRRRGDPESLGPVEGPKRTRVDARVLNLADTPVGPTPARSIFDSASVVGTPAPSISNQEMREKNSLIPVDDNPNVKIATEVIVKNSASARRIILLETDADSISRGKVEPGNLDHLFKLLCGGRLEFILPKPEKEQVVVSYVHPKDAYKFIEFMASPAGKQAMKRNHAKATWHPHGALREMPEDNAEAINKGASRCIRVGAINKDNKLPAIKEMLTTTATEHDEGCVLEYKVITDRIHNNKGGISVYIEYTHLDIAVKVKECVNNKEKSMFAHAFCVYERDNYWMNENGKYLTPEAVHMT